MALNRTSFQAMIPELDACIETQMDAISLCDNLEKCEELERDLHDQIEALDARMDKMRAMQRELNTKERTLVKDIRRMMIGANGNAECGKRQYINNVRVNGGNVTINQE